MPKELSRSQSREEEVDSEMESHADQESPNQGPGKPGRKKNPNSQAARRDQNRIAQREFRLRKQQKIRDLEARVELLSASQDEALIDLRAILRDLMAENLHLRNLLKSVSGFIGEGAGGFVAKMGWDIHDFQAFLNKSETDTAWESFQSRRHTQKTAHSDGSTSSAVGSQGVPAKRLSEDDAAPGRAKKLRGMGTNEGSAERQDPYPLLMPMSTTVPPPPPPATNSLYPSAARSPQDSLFSDLMRNGHANSPVFMPPTPGSSGHYGTSSASSTYSYLPQINLVDQGMNSLSYTSAKSGTARGQARILSQTNTAPEEPDDEEELMEPKKIEAMKLIRYHLDNYARNSAYCLPSSLRPTLVQRTVNHESIIDRIVHPELRDRIILLRGQFSLADCLFDYKKSVKVHGDDVLAHANWELTDWWLRKYSYLVERATLDICNRWRRDRGEPELKLSDISAQGESPAS